MPGSKSNGWDGTAGLTAAVCCVTGQRAQNNEDNFYLDGDYKAAGEGDGPVLRTTAVHPGSLFAVCDGMGGMSLGEVAAATAVATLAEGPPPPGGPFGATEAQSWAAHLSHAVRREGRRLGVAMGTTLVLAAWRSDGVDLYNIGDSRAYLWQAGGITQLSRDHTMAQSLLDMGIVRSGRRQNALTQYLGMEEDEFTLEPHVCRIVFPPEGALLLCSDGLTDELTDGEIAALLGDTADAATGARALADAACAAGGRDNVTALVIRRPS